MIWLLPTYNMLGGRGAFPLSKQLFRCVLMPFMVAMHFGFDLYITVCAFAGFALWAIPGHGKYFGEIWYSYNKTSEEEIRWIDWVGRELLPMEHVGRGVLSMGLRGMLLYPFFLLMIPYNAFAPIIGLGMLLQGLCYLPDRYFDFSGDGALSEWLTGLLIAALVFLL